jgi:hypothetical protein
MSDPRITDEAVEAGVAAWATAGAVASVQIRAALEAALPHLVPQSDMLRSALADLVWLKDGPRDDDYYKAKDAAWQAARDALTDATPAPQPVIDREALIERIAYEFADYPEGLSFVTALDGGILPGRQVAALAADAVLTLLNGGAS